MCQGNGEVTAAHPFCVIFILIISYLPKVMNEEFYFENKIIVVKNAEDITWLADPLAELKARLLQIRKIWGVEIVVLNEELAGEYKLTC